ncbi:MAG: hypothetical protein ACTHJ7_04915 [Candidatus Nitrosocosmicus sp.]
MTNKNNNEASEFKNSLINIKNNNEASTLQKIHFFYQLCKRYNIEPIILRLSGEVKNKIKRTGYLITFTSSRIIILKKSNLKNLIDIGYTAGLGPYPYYLVSDKVNYDDIKLKDSLIQKTELKNELIINYDDIKKFVFYNGIETLITNMLGSAVSENLLIIHTKSDSYKFVISVKKMENMKRYFIG